MVPITGRAGSFLEFLKLQSQSKLNPNQIKSNPFFCSSFFHCLQGQSELCGSYHLLQSCFSFFVCLHGQLEPFGSYHLLQSCFSFFVHLHGQTEPFGSCIILQSCSSFSSVSTADLRCLLVTTFSSLSFLSNSFLSPCFNLLRVARHCFSLSSVSDDLFFSSCNFLVILLVLPFSCPILSLCFLCSSISEALFALSFHFYVNVSFSLAYS